MYSSAIDLGSGALGGVVTVVLGQPMDTVKVSCVFFLFREETMWEIVCNRSKCNRVVLPAAVWRGASPRLPGETAS